jgi:hypothetical protein
MAARIETVVRARLAPPGPRGGRGIAQLSGVFDAAGRPVELAVTHGRAGRLELHCDPPRGALPLRSGRWLFGGIAFQHFGHALVFSTSRLWALFSLSGLDGILFLDRPGDAETREGAHRHLAAILQVLGVELPVITVARPEEVERLIVPEQGQSTATEAFCGSPEMRAWLRRAIERIAPAGRGRRIYVSRTALGPDRPGVMFEPRIEAALQTEGWEILHPQTMPLADQIAAYRGASAILGVEGSAMHLAAMSVAPTARFGVIARRGGYADDFAAQARAYGAREAVAIRAILGYAAPASAVSDGSWSARAIAVPDVPGLEAGLRQAGFLKGAIEKPARAGLNRRLARLGALAGEPYLLVSPDHDPG